MCIHENFECVCLSMSQCVYSVYASAYSVCEGVWSAYVAGLRNRAKAYITVYLCSRGACPLGVLSGPYVPVAVWVGVGVSVCV